MMGKNGVSFHSPKSSLHFPFPAQTQTDNRLIWENITTAAGFQQKRLTDADADCMTSVFVEGWAKISPNCYLHGFLGVYRSATESYPPASNLFLKGLPVPEGPGHTHGGGGSRGPKEGGSDGVRRACQPEAETDLIGLVSSPRYTTQCGKLSMRAPFSDDEFRDGMSA